MEVHKVSSITSNEQHVRLEIFAGRLPIDEAAAELLRIEKAQRESDNRLWQERYDRLLAQHERLSAQVSKT